MRSSLGRSRKKKGGKKRKAPSFTPSELDMLDALAEEVDGDDGDADGNNSSSGSGEALGGLFDEDLQVNALGMGIPGVRAIMDRAAKQRYNKSIWWAYRF